MDTKEIKTLKILEALEKDYIQSQRELSSALNISLGLVNSLLKDLERKELFSLKTLSKNKVKYSLTQKGQSEKTRLFNKYFQHSFVFYRKLRQKVKLVLKELEDKGVKKIAIFGVSDLAEIIYLTTKETSLIIVTILDDTKIGKTFFEFKVEDLYSYDYSKIEKAIITQVDLDEIVKKNISKLKIAKDKLIFLEVYNLNFTQLT